jgi:GTP:adenosylcobinamide-phosphate guanylyltransferase
MPQIVAVIAAGQDLNREDPLHEYTQGCPKALIPIAGKPMISYVVGSLGRSNYIQSIIVAGLSHSCNPVDVNGVTYLPDSGSIIKNYEAGMRHAQQICPDLDAVLLCSADIPTITPEIVDEFIMLCLETNHDLYYAIVERSLMELRFPGSGRSYVHLKEGAYAGGDILLVKPGLVLENDTLWHSLESARKNVFRQARLLGYRSLFKLLLHRLSLTDAERGACAVLGINGKALPFSHPEIGMDVDKPFQLDIVRADIEARIQAGQAI